jgi:hypothetical protein
MTFVFYRGERKKKFKNASSDTWEIQNNEYLSTASSPPSLARKINLHFLYKITSPALLLHSRRTHP